MTQRSTNALFATWSFILLAGAICLTVAVGSIVQPASAGEESKPEKKGSDVWQLQAQSVAESLGLKEESGTKLTDAYIAIRTARRQLLAAKQKKEGEDGNHPEDNQELSVLQRNELATAIDHFLTTEQKQMAIVSLGSFSARWDRYVKQIQGYHLEASQQEQAMQLVLEYITNYGAARKAAKVEGSRFSSVTAKALKATLDNGIARLLSEEQLSDWNEATAFRGGGSAGAAGKGGQGANNKAGLRSAAKSN